MEGSIPYQNLQLYYTCPPKYTATAQDKSEDASVGKTTVNVNDESRQYFIVFIIKYYVCKLNTSACMFCLSSRLPIYSIRLLIKTVNEESSCPLHPSSADQAVFSFFGQSCGHKA